MQYYCSSRAKLLSLARNACGQTRTIEPRCAGGIIHFFWRLQDDSESRSNIKWRAWSSQASYTTWTESPASKPAVITRRLSFISNTRDTREASFSACSNVVSKKEIKLFEAFRTRSRAAIKAGLATFSFGSKTISDACAPGVLGDAMQASTREERVSKGKELPLSLDSSSLRGYGV